LRILIITVLFTLISISSISQDRAMWATIWSSSTPEKINNIINNAHKYKFNKLFLQVRYRGDALYFPNLTDSTYTNNEERCYILNQSNFDPLKYAIYKAKSKNIEIHAWVPIFVVTPHDLSKINSNHVYYKHKDWLTYNQQGKAMAYNSHEGAFLDPGVPAVQKYTLDILQDIASNYDVDGIQMDYIRYPDSLYGYNPMARTNFEKSNYKDFEKWKQSQINSFVNKAFIMLKNINPNLQLSAAVFGNQHKAINRFSQNWKQWISDNYIDKVYVMAYSTSEDSFKTVLQDIKEVNKEKTTIVLRAWIDNGKYSVHQINKKISISKKMGFYNLGFYSYSGLIKNNYLPHLH